MGFQIGQKLIKKYEYDFAVDGGASTAVINLREEGENLVNGCHITKMYVVTETAFTSAISDTTITIGNTTDADGYFADCFTALSSTTTGTFSSGEIAGALLWDDSNDHDILYSPKVANDLTVAMTIGNYSLTAGKLELYVEFFRA
jgi:hypothetical protein